LTLLQEEFPDVTISKIRFLESQGLLNPERTPSGYRKFHDADVERLRWILHQQKEHFLPLKVIKDRLDEHDGPGLPPEGAPGDAEPASGTDDAQQLSLGEAPPPPPPPPPSDGAVPSSDATAESPGAVVRASVGSGVSMDLAELAAASGLSSAELAELERFGLIVANSLGGAAYYDEEAVVAARHAATLLSHGIEPRHLRMYRTAVDREAGIYEALVLPRLAQRRPGSHEEAMAVLDEIVGAGDALRAGLMRRVLRDDLQRR
jgi:DNA-binding transcriptional MerR regulator